MIMSIIAIIGGLIAASPLIIAQKPDAKELLDKVTPYQGWIGLVLLVWGIFGVFNALSLLGIFSLGWFILTAGIAAAEIVVGFLLGYGLISKYFLESNESAKVKGMELRMKLSKYQVPAGIVLVVLGIVSIITRGSMMV